MSDQTEDGIWIFVSHSNRDIARVRQIRDELEREGHKPLLFFLKCLTDKDPRLPGLLKDEIKARTWFILCDSENARKSPWVQEEVRIVKTTKPEGTFAYIDLNWSLDAIMSKIRPLIRRATVFFSYARPDATIARQIRDALLAEDYNVFFDEQSITAGSIWEQQLQRALEDAVQRGFVLLLLSPDYLTSAWCKAEREWAFKKLGASPLTNIVPVIVRDAEQVLRELPPDLRRLECIDLSKGSILDHVSALVHDLKRRPMAQHAYPG